MLAKSLAIAALSLLATSAVALAQDPSSEDPIIANVDGEPVRRSEIDIVAASLPDHMRQMPPQMLYPMLMVLSEASKTR